jgi:hypothetical protein
MKVRFVMMMEIVVVFLVMEKMTKDRMFVVAQKDMNGMKISKDVNL